MSAGAEVTGLEELARKLLELERDMSENILRSSTAAAASVFRREVELRAPFKTGRLRRAIYVKRLRSSNYLRQEFFVGARKGKRYQEITLKFGKNKGQTINMDGYHARFLEFGTRKMSAHPFFRPAYDSKREVAIEAFKRRIKAGLAKYGAK